MTPDALLGESITVNWTGRNTGPNPIDGFWSDSVYLSSDTMWDLGDRLLGRVEKEQILTVDGTYSSELTATVPSVRARASQRGAARRPG